MSMLCPLVNKKCLRVVRIGKFVRLGGGVLSKKKKQRQLNTTVIS